jgi:hypothetical protein
MHHGTPKWKRILKNQKKLDWRKHNDDLQWKITKMSRRFLLRTWFRKASLRKKSKKNATRKEYIKLLNRKDCFTPSNSNRSSFSIKWEINENCWNVAKFHFFRKTVCIAEIMRRMLWAYISQGERGWKSDVNIITFKYLEKNTFMIKRSVVSHKNKWIYWTRICGRRFTFLRIPWSFHLWKFFHAKIRRKSPR